MCWVARNKIKLSKIVKKKVFIDRFWLSPSVRGSIQGVVGFFFFSDQTHIIAVHTKKNSPIKIFCFSVIVIFFFRTPADREERNKTNTWLTCSYLKPPPDGSFCICATEGASQEDFITTAYTRQVCTHLKSLLEISKLHSHSIKKQQQQPFLMKSCTNSKSMLGFVSPKEVDLTFDTFRLWGWWSDWHQSQCPQLDCPDGLSQEAELRSVQVQPLRRSNVAPEWGKPWSRSLLAY